jgi:FMN-dependent NADH-azoreductase
MAPVDHQETYLRHVLGFIGITDVEFVRAEGLGMGDDSRRQAIETALGQADALSSRSEAVAA